MMQRKYMILSIIFTLSLILLTASRVTSEQGDLSGTWVDDGGNLILGPFAPCDHIDLAGNWEVQLAGTDGLGQHCWEYSNLQVTSSGAIEGGTYTDCQGVTSDVTGGELTISTGCVMEGTIETLNGTFSINCGAITGENMVLGMAGD